jgi:hypothetical protein
MSPYCTTRWTIASPAGFPCRFETFLASHTRGRLPQSPEGPGGEAPCDVRRHRWQTRVPGDHLAAGDDAYAHAIAMPTGDRLPSPGHPLPIQTPRQPG